MAESLCPLCSTALEERKVAPCWDCGPRPDELDHLIKGEHQYHHCTVFGHEAILCDFCDADFYSYIPSHFGVRKIPFGAVERIRPVENPQPKQDLVCPECQQTKSFLDLIIKVREANQKQML